MSPSLKGCHVKSQKVYIPYVLSTIKKLEKIARREWEI